MNPQHAQQARQPINPPADTLTYTEDGRTALRMERRLAHPPERVWEALTRPELIARWFPSEVTADLRPGGAITFRFPEGGDAEAIGYDPAVEMAGTVLEVASPWVYVFTWGDERLHWSVRRDHEAGSGHCLLDFVHTFDDHYGAASTAAGWHRCLSALAQVLDSGSDASDGPEGADDADGSGFGTGLAELHEAYLEQFDLGGGTVEKTPEGHRIRFERQLVRPLAAVWDELTGGQEPQLGAPPPPGFVAQELPASAADETTEVDAPHLLAFARHPDGDRVRWELGAGTGEGPRLVLTHIAAPADTVASAGFGGFGGIGEGAALAAWHARLELLAAKLLEQGD